MLRYSKEKLKDERSITALYSKANKELSARRQLYERVTRKIDESSMASISDEDIKIPLERYISVTASGFFGGKAPKYKVRAYNKDIAKINKDIFDFDGNDEEALKEMQQIIAHITDYNDDEAHHFQMTWDFLTKRACYEIYYKNDMGEYVYTTADPLETVAIEDYSMPRQVIGLYRIIRTVTADNKYLTMVELTTEDGKFYYNATPEKMELFVKDTEQYTEKYKDEPLFKLNTDETEKNGGKKWADVPFTAIESEDNLTIYELLISLIKAYERVVQNGRNTHQYNDTAKLHISGYVPANSMGTDDRETEDEKVLKSKTIYTQEGGNVEWVTKNINDGAMENHKKTLMDLICLCSFVPNMTDLGFTQADNNSALEKKFFNLQQYISTFKGEFKKAYTRRWEVLLNKINIDKGKHYDFRDIEIILNVNLPTDTSSETSRALSLRDLLSDETIINMLPDDLDALNEITKKKEEAETNLYDNQKLMQQFSNNNKNEETNTDEDLEDNTEEQINKTPGETIKGSVEKEEKSDSIEDLDKLKK